MEIIVNDAELVGTTKRISLEAVLEYGGKEVELSLTITHTIAYYDERIEWESNYTDDDELLELDNVQDAIDNFVQEWVYNNSGKL
jgi:hypothetical protein